MVNEEDAVVVDEVVAPVLEVTYVLCQLQGPVSTATKLAINLQNAPSHHKTNGVGIVEKLGIFDPNVVHVTADAGVVDAVEEAEDVDILEEAVEEDKSGKWKKPQSKGLRKKLTRLLLLRLTRQKTNHARGF